MPGHIVIRRLTKLVTSGVVDRITLDAYPDDVHIEWVRIMARVVGADATLIEIGTKSGKSDYPMKSQKITNVGQSVNVTTAMYGSGDYQLYAEFTDTTIAQTMELTAFGRREHLG